jgi:hypothetical protein
VRPLGQALRAVLVGTPDLSPSADGRGLRLPAAPGRPHQQALHLLLRVREPHAERSAALLKLWTRGAPAWEAALRAADPGVHFAWVLPVAGGRELAICALCDGDPQATLAALIGQAPELFRETLAEVVLPLPLPGVDQPAELAAHLLHHNPVPAPVAGYLFSARPDTDLAALDQALAAWRARGARP